ncbi:MICOS complex subunit Mic60-like isoform X1 [Macrosteles quadrilineatus]|uniref:MICOS complex subunit Mic60-like isoform X1 n=1 Tax=Macrosteles quadrilineatus TaxID=74068 RepID=UPI0023E1DF80|nr:MICOS complex subunit Mic60-like isoform X1 [Macrosteles quadrilineatus]
MIRCCSKFFIPLPSKSGPLCLSRIYVASNSRNFNQKRYASGESQPPRRLRKLFYSTIGLTLIGVGGAVVYAKNDPKFRKVLDSYVPGSDKVIRILYQEEGSLNLGGLSDQLSTIQDKVLSIPNDIYKQISGTSSEKSTSLLTKEKDPKSEDSVKLKPKQASPVLPPVKEITIEEKVIQKSSPAFDSTKKPVAVVNVSVTDIKTLGNEAVKLYNELFKEMDEKAKEIIAYVSNLENSKDPKKTWKAIQEKLEENVKLKEEIDKRFQEAGEKTKKFSSLLKQSNDQADLKSLESELNKAKEKAEAKKRNKLASSMEYVSAMEETLQKSSDELMTLFPNLRPGRHDKLTDDEIDLFIYYSFHKLLYYQKEIKKHEATVERRLKEAISSKDDSQLLEVAIESKVAEGKRNLQEDFDKKMIELKKDCDDEVHKSLKRQEQVHLDLLKEQLALKEKEVERKLIQRMEDKVLEEQARLQAELAEMTGRMQGLNEAIAKRALQDQKAQTSQALWSAAEALYDSLKHGAG